MEELSATPVRILSIQRYISLGLFQLFIQRIIKKKSLPMEVINRYAAGIDVGSRFHYVAIGQNPQDVRKFGVYNEDLKELLQ